MNFVKEVNPHPCIVPCVNMWSVTLLFLFLFYFSLCHLLNVGACICHIVREGLVEWTRLTEVTSKRIQIFHTSGGDKDNYSPLSFRMLIHGPHQNPSSSSHQKHQPYVFSENTRLGFQLVGATGVAERTSVFMENT